MAKHSSKTLIAHKVLVQAMLLQLDALALSHPTQRTALMMCGELLARVQIPLPAEPTTAQQLLTAPRPVAPPYGAPSEMPPDDAYEDPDDADALPAPVTLSPEELA